jgi:hypothetical protein
MISSCSAARLWNKSKTDLKSAENIGPHGNRCKIGNSQFISQIGVYEIHSLNEAAGAFAAPRGGYGV